MSQKAVFEKAEQLLEKRKYKFYTIFLEKLQSRAKKAKQVKKSDLNLFKKGLTSFSEELGITDCMEEFLDFIITNRTRRALIVGGVTGIASIIADRFFGREAHARPNPFVDVLTYSRRAQEEVLVDPVYYTSRNFMGRRLVGYNAHKVWAHPKVINELMKANKILKQKGVQFLVKDCYRPRSASGDMVSWALKQQRRHGVKLVPTYIAKYSNHNTGRAIDITFATYGRRKDKEIWMGSNFDEFFDPIKGKIVRYPNYHRTRAKTSSDDKWAYGGGYVVPLRPNTMLLRKQLRKVMRSIRYKPMRAEWWHFTTTIVPRRSYNIPIR